MSGEQQSQTWEATRKQVLDRDGHACRFCDMTEKEHQEKHDQGLHAHHVLPRNAGGRDVHENLITVCISCHQTIESAHADAVEEHIRSDGNKELDHHVQEILSRWDDSLNECEKRINSYLKRHPSIQQRQEIYATPDPVNLHFPDEYQPKFVHGQRGIFEIESEYDLFLSIGFRSGLLMALCDMDDDL